MPNISVLLVGDTSRAEFREACSALEEAAEVTRVATVEEAIAVLEDGTEVHGVALAQAWPGQFSAGEIDRLRDRAPLARFVAVLGSWCEGEPRSGHPLPGVVRIYWHQAAVRIRREFALGSPLQAAAWRLPATATEEERLLATLDEPLPRGTGLIALWTRRPEMAELLGEACRGNGYTTVWLHPRQQALVEGEARVEEAAAGIFDGESLDPAGLAELEQFAASVSPATVLALLYAPRIQDLRRAKTLGAAVMAKPFRLDELLWLLQRQVNLKICFPAMHQGSLTADR